MITTKKAPLSVIGCSMAIFWSGFLAFGYPGIMSTYWQQRYNVGAVLMVALKKICVRIKYQ